MMKADQTLAEAATALPETVRKRPKEAARLRKWVKRAIADLPADALNRLAAICAMHLDQEALKRTGKSPGNAKAVVDELRAEHVAKVQMARMDGSPSRWPGREPHRRRMVRTKSQRRLGQVGTTRLPKPWP